MQLRCHLIVTSVYEIRQRLGGEQSRSESITLTRSSGFGPKYALLSLELVS